MTATESTGAGPRSKTPVHLWIVGVLALLWNCMGAFDYLATQLKLESYMGQFTPEWSCPDFVDTKKGLRMGLEVFTNGYEATSFQRRVQA